MTMNTERRKFIAGVGAAAASTAVLAGGQALAQGNQQIGAKAIPYQGKPMPFDPKSITGISEKVLVSHYENNYVGAVKRLNAIGTQLAELDFAKAANFVINGLKREELIASNSMILHEIYFEGAPRRYKTKWRVGRSHRTRLSDVILDGYQNRRKRSCVGRVSIGTVVFERENHVMSVLTVDFQKLVNPRPFSRFQNTVSVLGFPADAAEGFDTAAVGFIAPTLKLSAARSAP